MPAEAAFSATCKSPKGDLFTVRGDSYNEFVMNLGEALGTAEDANAFTASFASAFGASPLTEQQAVANIQTVFPAAQVAPPTASIGGGTVVPMPQAGQQYPASVPTDQPPVQHPLCGLHNQPARWVNGGVSRAGKPYNAFWACAVGVKGDGCKVGR